MPYVDAPAQQAITHEGKVIGRIWFIRVTGTVDALIAWWGASYPGGGEVMCGGREAAIAWLLEQHAKSLVKEGE